MKLICSMNIMYKNFSVMNIWKTGDVSLNLGLNDAVQGLQDEYDRNFNILLLGKLTGSSPFLKLLFGEKSTGKKDWEFRLYDNEREIISIWIYFWIINTNTLISFEIFAQQLINFNFDFAENLTIFVIFSYINFLIYFQTSSNWMNLEKLSFFNHSYFITIECVRVDVCFIVSLAPIIQWNKYL